MEAFNPIETSKKVLYECNLLESKNPKVRYLGPGDGRLISTADKSVSELYNTLYPRPVHNVKFPSLYKSS